LNGCNLLNAQQKNVLMFGVHGVLGVIVALLVVAENRKKNGFLLKALARVKENRIQKTATHIYVAGHNGQNVNEHAMGLLKSKIDHDSSLINLSAQKNERVSIGIAYRVIILLKTKLHRIL
jgi:hypothetical protein